MKPFIISKRTPPPPHRGRSNRQLTIPALLFAAAASGALLLGACDSPTGENPNTNGGKVTPTSYTTTVTGRVTDKSTAAGVPDAEVSASTAPGTVVKTRSDGSFTFQVKEHTGTFTLTVKKAGYTPVTTERIDTTENTRTVPVIQLTKITPTGGGTPEPTATYTTTVTGKVITPAKAADPAKGRTISTAQVWFCIDPTNCTDPAKTDVGADGSYTLEVAGHTGSFTITADYTAADGKYTTSTAQTVNTTGVAVDQDIALKYGYTTTVTVQVALYPSGIGSGGITSSGVTVVITAEDGHEVDRGTTSGASSPSAVITVDHPGRMVITASRDGYTSDGSSGTTAVNTTAGTVARNLYLVASSSSL